MDYKRIAYGSFYDIKGRLWGVNLLRRTDSALTARELTFEGDEAAVAEWDEFDLERPIQGSSLTLRIISEADREWTSLYTVNDGEVVAEVTLEGKLWWRGSLDPETYEEPYEKAKDYTVELRFSDFGPLKRHQFVVPGDGGLIKAGMAIGSNLLAIGTVTGLSADGLPSNADISSIAPPDGQTAADMLGTGAGEDAFREDEDSTDYIKAWDALSALLTASGLRMTQRAGKIVLHNLKGLRDNAGSKAEECVWSGDSQTLGADRIASRVVVSHSGEGSSNLLPVLKTGREQDVRVLSLPYGYSPDDPYNSFFLTLYETSTWQRPEKAWGFFTLRAGLDNVASTDGWMMWAYRNNRGNSPFNTAIKDHPFYSGPQTDTANTPSVAISPKTYIHLIDRPGAFNKPESGFLIKVEQEMLFDCRYNPFANDGNNDLYQKPQDTYAKTQFAYVLAELTIETASGKKYWWTNADRIYSETSISNLFACHSFDSGKWSETKAPYWIQYRTREKKEDGQIIGAGWTVNKPFVSIPNSIKWKNLKYNKVTQKLPDGDLIPLPPERGWMTLEVFAAVRFIGDGISGNAPLAAMRWILGKGARISIVDANSNFEMPESSESEVKVICNNGAEDITEVAPLLGSGGGYLGCRSLIINADGSVAEKGAPELRTASEIASQLCMRRTRLTGEAYINTTAPLSFTERLQTGRIFHLASERMDLQKGFGDRVITELVRTDIDGLEVRRNERVIFSGTADRGGRDGKDAEVYSIIPTATAVTVKSSSAIDADGNVTVATEYVPAELGCSVYLTVGNDMTKTRDGILKRRITDANGKTISDVVVETDGGEAEPVAVPKGSASIEFKLLTDDSEDAMTLAICTIPVEGGNILYPDYDKDKDTLNFRTPFGDLYLRDSIDLSKYKDISISTGTGLTGGGTLEEDRTLSLDESGVKPGTYTKVTVDKYGRTTKGDTLLASDIPTLPIGKIDGLQSALDLKLNKSVFDDMFRLETVNGVKRIKALHGLYTDEYLSARGSNPDATDGTAGLDEKQLGEYLALHGYATQGWVTGKGYLTSAALTGYATQAWVEGKKYLTSHQTIRTLTIQKNGTTVDTFTPNGTANKTINLTDVASAATLSAHVADTSLHFTDALLTKLNGIEDGANNYTHPSHTATTVSAANGKVLSSITVNALGHVTAVGSKNLAAADIPSLAISKISGLQSALDAKLEKSVYEAFKAVFDDMFRLETVNGVKRIKALHGLYTDEYLSARGSNPDATDGTAGLDEKQLGEYLALHGYATQGWVTGKGYLTSAALTGYATQAWVEGKKYLTSHQTIRTLTIQKNGTTVDTFTPNGTANKTINLTDVASAATLSAHVADTSLHFTDALLTKLNGIEDGANNYKHPSHTATTISAANGKVLSSITVNALGHVTAVGSKNLAAADIPSLDWSKITSGKPTTLAGYGISDAYTKTEADGRYVNVTGDTMTGTLTISIDTASVNHIAFTRASWNYISATQPGGILAFCTNGVSPSSSNGTLYLEGKNGRPGQNNVGSWGTSSLRWSNVYSVLGNFSGLVTAAAGIQIGDCKITWVAGKGLCFSKGIYSEEHVSARGANSAGGSGSSFGRLDDWSKYSASGSDALSAKLGYGLKTDLDALTSRVSTLEKKNYLDALTLSVTGSGNAVTSATLSADKKTITLTKGTTFLTSHQSLANYVTLNTAQTISGVKTFSNGIKLNTATSWTAGDRVIPFSQYDDMSVIRYYSDNADKGLTFNANSGALKAGSFVKRGGTSAQFLKADGSVDVTSYLPSSTYTASDILTKLKTVDGSGSGLDADLLDGVHASGLFTALTSANESLSLTIGGTSKSVDVQSAGYKWNAVTTVNSWSKLLKIAGYANVLLSVNLSQNSQASNHLYLISCGYNTARIIQLGANGYAGHSAAQIRVTKSAATTFDIEILNDYGYNGATSLSVACKALRLDSQCTLTAYTAYTAGSGTECSSITSSSSAIVSDIKFTTARTIWGQSFDGSGNVSGNLTSVGNITGSGAMTLKATGVLTLNGTTGVYLKYNNEDAKSVVLNGSAFKPFDSANNKLTLGSTSARWSNVYSVLGNFSGLVTASAGIQIGDCKITWVAGKGLCFSKGIYSEEHVSARGANSAGSSSGGLIQTVYGYGDLGKVFSDLTKSDTFNAYTINKLYADKADKTALNSYYTKTEVNSKLTDGSVTKVGTSTKGSASLPIYLNAGVPTACTGSSIFSALTTSNDQLSVTVAGQNRVLTIPYATYAGRLKNNTDLTYGASGLQWFNISGTAGCVAKVNDTPTTAWWHILRFNHANSTGYYTDLAIPFNANSLYYKRIGNGSLKTDHWVQIVDDLNYSSIITKIGTATVGSTSKPIYLNAGVPTAISATVGSATKPVYLSAGTVTACSYAFGNGSGNVPVSNGTVNTNLNADMLDGKHNGSVSAADSQWLKIITNMGYDFANVGAAKDRLAELFGTQSGGIGYAINIGASVISHWTDDSFVPVASSTFTVIKLSGTYSGSTYGTWLLASYGDTRLKVIGRSQNAWTTMRTLATTDDNVASANRLSGTTARTAWGQTFFTTGGVPQSISGNLTSVGNITGSGAMTIQSTGGRLTLNAPTTGLDLKFNNTDTKSVILNGTAFKPFDAADNALELGTDAARWKKITAVNMRLSSSTSAGGGDVYLEMWRGTNASWKVLNTGGTLKFQSNYTTAVQSTYFDCFTLAYNTGNAYLKGRLGIGTTAPSYPLDVNGNIRAQSGWLRNTGAYGWYNETYGGGWYMQDSTWIRAYGGKSVYIAAPASLKIGDCTIKYENGALHFDKGIYSDEFVSAKGLNAEAGAGGLIEKVYDIDSIGKTFSKTTLSDTFNAHAIQSIATRVSDLEGKNYLNDLNVTTTGTGNAITSATLSADKKTLTLTKGTTFATTTQLTNGSVTKVGTATVGSTSKPIYLNAGVPTALSATVGSATKPVYLSAGAITASSSTVGGTAKPMYLNAGTMTALSATVGASNQPVYLNAGTITAVSGVGIGYLSEGGPNKSGSLGPFDYIDGISASNKFEGLPGQYIKVELWSGSAWVDAGLTDAQKTSLVSYEGLTVSASQTNATSGNKIRVTITAAAGVLYFACNKICINFSYNGATNSKVLIERAHVGSETTFETLGTYGVSGWSGWNSIYFGAMNFGGGTTQTSNWRVLRFTFTADAATSDSYKTNKIAVYNILAYGKTAWSYANVLNKWGRPYTYSPSTFLSTFIGGLKPNSNNAHDLGTSSYRWNYIYGAYGNFSTSVTTTQVTSTGSLFLDGTNLVTMRYNNSGLMMGVQLSAATLQPTANCAGSLSLGSSSARWNATYIKSLNVTDSMTSSKVSSTHLAANQGQAIINSTASAGSYTMLAKMNTTNGYMLMGSWLKAFRLAYTSKENVDKGTNGTDKSVNLLDEDGITTLNILKVGTNGGDFLVNGDSVSIGTTTTISNTILVRRHITVANANMFFTTTTAGTGEGLYFAPVANGSNPYLGLMKHNNRAWTADAVRFYNNGVVWAKTGIWTDGYISARGQNTSSDVRLKKDFAPFSLRLKDIAEAPSVRFRWKTDGREDLGSIAQHFRRVSPLLTPQSPDGTLTLQYGKTALLAVIAVAKETECLRERVARLESENNRLKEIIENIKTA